MILISVNSVYFAKIHDSSKFNPSSDVDFYCCHLNFLTWFIHLQNGISTFTVTDISELLQ